MLSAVVGGIAAGAVASIVAKEMCKKNKKTSEEKEAKTEQSYCSQLSYKKFIY